MKIKLNVIIMTLNRRELFASQAHQFISTETAPHTNWIGNKFGSRANLDTVPTTCSKSPYASKEEKLLPM
jgi:hypothetical protein